MGDFYLSILKMGGKFMISWFWVSKFVLDNFFVVELIYWKGLGVIEFFFVIRIFYL